MKPKGSGRRRKRISPEAKGPSEHTTSPPLSSSTTATASVQSSLHKDASPELTLDDAANSISLHHRYATRAQTRRLQEQQQQRRSHQQASGMLDATLNFTQTDLGCLRKLKLRSRGLLATSTASGGGVSFLDRVFATPHETDSFRCSPVTKRRATRMVVVTRNRRLRFAEDTKASGELSPTTTDSAAVESRAITTSGTSMSISAAISASGTAFSQAFESRADYLPVSNLNAIVPCNNHCEIESKVLLSGFSCPGSSAKPPSPVSNIQIGSQISATSDIGLESQPLNDDEPVPALHSGSRTSCLTASTAATSQIFGKDFLATSPRSEAAKSVDPLVPTPRRQLFFSSDISTLNGSNSCAAIEFHNTSVAASENVHPDCGKISSTFGNESLSKNSTSLACPPYHGRNPRQNTPFAYPPSEMTIASSVSAGVQCNSEFSDRDLDSAAWPCFCQSAVTEESKLSSNTPASSCQSSALSVDARFPSAETNLIQSAQSASRMFHSSRSAYSTHCGDLPKVIMLRNWSSAPPKTNPDKKSFESGIFDSCESCDSQVGSSAAMRYQEANYESSIGGQVLFANVQVFKNDNQETISPVTTANILDIDVDQSEVLLEVAANVSFKKFIHEELEDLQELSEDLSTRPVPVLGSQSAAESPVRETNAPSVEAASQVDLLLTNESVNLFAIDVSSNSHSVLMPPRRSSGSLLPGPFVAQIPSSTCNGESNDKEPYSLNESHFPAKLNMPSELDSIVSLVEVSNSSAGTQTNCSCAGLSVASQMERYRPDDKSDSSSTSKQPVARITCNKASHRTFVVLSPKFAPHPIVVDSRASPARTVVRSATGRRNVFTETEPYCLQLALPVARRDAATEMTTWLEVESAASSNDLVSHSLEHSTDYRTELELTVNDSSIRRQLVDSVHASHLYTTLGQSVIDDSEIRRHLIPSVSAKDSNSCDRTASSFVTVWEGTATDSQIIREFLPSLHGSNLYATIEPFITFSDASIRRVLVPSVTERSTVSTAFDLIEFNPKLLSYLGPTMDTYDCQNSFNSESGEIYSHESDKTQDNEQRTHLVSWRSDGGTQEAGEPLVQSNNPNSIHHITQSTGLTGAKCYESQATVEAVDAGEGYFQSTILRPNSGETFAVIEGADSTLKLLPKNLYSAVCQSSGLPAGSRHFKSQATVEAAEGDKRVTRSKSAQSSASANTGVTDEVYNPPSGPPKSGHFNSPAIEAKVDELDSQSINVKVTKGATNLQSLTHSRLPTISEEVVHLSKSIEQAEKTIVLANSDDMPVAEKHEKTMATVRAGAGALADSTNKQHHKPAKSTVKGRKKSACYRITRSQAALLDYPWPAATLEPSEAAIAAPSTTDIPNNSNYFYDPHNHLTRAAPKSTRASIALSHLLPLDCYSFFCDEGGLEFDLTALQRVALITRDVEQYRQSNLANVANAKRWSERIRNNPPMRLHPTLNVRVFGFVGHPVRKMDRVLIGFLDPAEHSRLKRIVQKR